MNEQVLNDGTVISPPKGKKFTHNLNRLSSIIKRLNVTKGYCPCIKDSSNEKALKCPCITIREEGECRCGLFENIE